MRIGHASVFVDDQEKALRFYTDVLGFLPAQDVPLGQYRWLTVVSPEAPDGVELLLEPDAHPAARAFKAALQADNIPVAMFTVEDALAEADRLRALGVRLVREPERSGPVTTLVLDDTCGNLVQLTQLHR
jgi:catechol 2,3-dioxygenase-like lactoylglutathione lyase family enzyme